MFTIAIEKSSTLEESARGFLNHLRNWVYVCIEKYEVARMIDDPDQSVFMTSWEPYLQATGDQRALDFLILQRDHIRGYFMETEQWNHGYWAYLESQVGIDHFLRFLGMLSRFAPRDPFTRGQILDAAEHLGNWVERVPAWFDWERGLFLSSILGTEEINQEEGARMNTPIHLRLANLALLAYRISNRHRYLDLAAACAKPWCESILRVVKLPIALLPDQDRGVLPVYALDSSQVDLYRAYLGDRMEDLEDPMARAERFLAADAINVFLRLWRYLGEDEFLLVAERLLDVLVGALEDPDAGAVADAVRSYWRTTGSSRYNASVLSAVQKMPAASIRELGLEDAGPRLKLRPPGIGKSVDMLAWRENGAPRLCSPALVALAAEMTEDSQLATAALDLGCAYFKIARHVLLDGRSKASSARTVGAVARGNGRENHAGVTTAVLKPVLESFFPTPSNLFTD